MLCTLLLACDGEPADTSERQDTQVEEGQGAEPTGCDVLEVGFDGADPPVVGDLWTVWPVCDGNPVFGATVVRVDPATCASIGEGEVTWVEPGPCELMVQSGSQRAYLEVEVGPGR